MLVHFPITAFITARSAGPLDMQSQQATMKIIPMSLSQHMFSGNFSLIRMTDIYNEHTALYPTAFLPQTNAARLQRATDDKKRCTNEDIANIAADQKERPKTSLQLIGEMDAVKDYSCLLVNTMTICDSLIDNKAMVAAGGGSIFARLLCHLFLS